MVLLLTIDIITLLKHYTLKKHLTWQILGKTDGREAPLSALSNTLIGEGANLKNAVIYLKAKNNKNNNSKSMTHTSLAIRDGFGWVLEPWTMRQN